MSTATTRIILFALFLRPVLAQAPANDVISWPAGLLLLASVLYAALGQHSDNLWAVDPSVGLFLGTGLPVFSLNVMRHVNWVSNACHFVSDIRTAHGKSNFWLRSNAITQSARAQALENVSSFLHCVLYEPLAGPIDSDLWRLTPAGLMAPITWTALPPSDKPSRPDAPTARDFLLFAATDYHVFRDCEVNVYHGPQLQFCTRGMPASSVIDIDNEEQALAVVAAQMVRRPHSQTALQYRAENGGLTAHEGPWKLNLAGIDLDTPICAIDFHSYSPQSSKVSASLRELARSYHRVVSHIRQIATASQLESGDVAKVNVGQTMWIAILGGALLDKGRMTFQNLPGRWGVKGLSVDEAYLNRVQAVLDVVKPYANTSKFFDLVFSGGASRRPTYAFLIAGLCGQIIICYFLSVGTSAGVWTSVALANSLYTGRLTDWHTMFFGRTSRTSEPGMKMYVPESPSKELMVVATLDRSSPRAEAGLSPGFLLNVCGLAAAVLGAAFQDQTRASLGFGRKMPTAKWVVYTSIALSLGISFLIFVLTALQQLREHTWNDDSERPTRWATYSNILASMVTCALAIFFLRRRFEYLWPILDALIWLSGFPLGALENGRMISIDDNYLHLILLNRWILGAVSSSVGSSIR